jgi:hypothetical protein
MSARAGRLRERRLTDALAACHDGVRKVPIERGARSEEETAIMKFALHFGNLTFPLSRTVKRAGRILCRPILGGLHHEYVRI